MGQRYWRNDPKTNVETKYKYRIIIGTFKIFMHIYFKCSDLYIYMYIYIYIYILWQTHFIGEDNETQRWQRLIKGS